MDFFTVEDITIFARVAGHTCRNYRTEDLLARDSIKKGVWDKTQEWADRIRKRLNGA